VRRILTTAQSDKPPATPPIDHFKRLLEEACPNHTYPDRNKLKDYDMIRCFMTSGSLTWGAELNEGSDGCDTMPFPKENAVTMVHRSCPLSGRHCVSSLSPRAITRCGWRHGSSGV
jgi:hypothetical protein